MIRRNRKLLAQAEDEWCHADVPLLPALCNADLHACAMTGEVMCEGRNAMRVGTTQGTIDRIGSRPAYGFEISDGRLIVRFVFRSKDQAEEAEIALHKVEKFNPQIDAQPLLPLRSSVA